MKEIEALYSKVKQEYHDASNALDRMAEQHSFNVAEWSFQHGKKTTSLTILHYILETRLELAKGE